MTPEQIGSEVRRELDKLGPGGAIADVVAVWPAVAGEQIAQNAWPARLARDGTLHVATTSSAWSFELGLLEPELRKRLAAALGERAPASLRFAPGRLAESAASEVSEEQNRRPVITEQHRQAGEELAVTVGDENLRKLVARAAAASLARASGDRPV